jgi:hypothetical protein
MKNLRRHNLMQLAMFFSIGLILTIEAAAQGAYADGKTAQLKASQIKRLKALRAPIAVPTYVPAGYRLKDAGGRVEMIGKFWSVDYWVTYENARGDSFGITSANEGLGDVPLYGFLYSKNPFFDVEIEVGMQDEVEKSKQLLVRGCETGWVANKRAYLPAGARSREQAYRATSTALTAKEVLKVMESLRYLQ